MTTIFDLQKATLAARARTGDKAIGTQVADGKVEVVRVVFDNRGQSTVTVLSGPHAPAAAIQALAAL